MTPIAALGNASPPSTDVEDTFAYDSGYGLADGGIIGTAGDLATYIGALGRQEPRLGDAALAELFSG